MPGMRRRGSPTTPASASTSRVISTVPVMFSYWAKGHHALELHKALNDHAAEVCRSHPRNYIGLATVPLQSPTLAIRELERCMDGLGLAGVQVGSHVNSWNLDAPELFEFFQACAEAGRRGAGASLGHDGHRLDAQVLAALAGRDAGRAVARGLLAHLRRRARAPAGPARVLRARRRQLPLHHRPDRARLPDAAGPGRHRQPAQPARLPGPDLVRLVRARRPRLALPARGRRRRQGHARHRLPLPLGEQEPGSHIRALGLPQAQQDSLFHGSALAWLGLDAGRFGAVGGTPA